MPVRRVVANDKVEADRGRVALQRGPIVYAAEWPDNPNGKVRNIVAAATRRRSRPSSGPTCSNGVEVIKGRAVGLAYDAQGTVHGTSRISSRSRTRHGPTAGAARWSCWLARTDAAAKPTPWPTVATTSTVTASGTDDAIPRRRHGRCRTAVNDGEEPTASNDRTSYFDWWPRIVARPNGSSTRSRAARRSRSVRCTGSRTRDHGRGRDAGVVACPLQGRRELEAGGRPRRLHRRSGSVQQDHLQPRQHRSPPTRVVAAAPVVGGHSGVEGPVEWRCWRHADT